MCSGGAGAASFSTLLSSPLSRFPRDGVPARPGSVGLILLGSGLRVKPYVVYGRGRSEARRPNWATQTVTLGRPNRLLARTRARPTSRQLEPNRI